MQPSFFNTTLNRILTVGGSETTISVSSLDTLTGETLSASYLTPFTKGYIIVDPLAQAGAQPEIISYTGIDTTAITFTGCVRGLSSVTTGVVAANKTYHGPGTPVIISWGAQNINDVISYINSLITGVAGNASTTVAGVTKLSTAPVNPLSPIAVGDNDPRMLTLAQLDYLVPVGLVSNYGKATPPTGWLNCDGSTISRSTYSALFSVIGTSYGVGDGSTTFGIPSVENQVMLKTFDATTTFIDGTATISGTTIAHTIGTKDSPILITGVSWADGTKTVSSVTYNGVAMTLIDTINSGGTNHALYYMVNPPTGAHNIVVTLSGNSSFSVNNNSFFGFSGLDTKTKATATSTTYTSSLAPTINGDLFVTFGLVGFNGTASSYSVDFTQVTATNVSPFYYSFNSSPNGVNKQFTPIFSNGVYGYVSACFKPNFAIIKY